MLVYGDRQRTEAPKAVLERIRRRQTGLDRVFPGVVRHGALAGALIEAGQLAQGLADAEFEARGGDAPSPVQEAAMALVMRLARELAASWISDFSALPADATPEIDTLAALDLPPRVTLKTPEGYAFYALYPEAYLEAAWELPEPPLVIGLRSIGASLAAMVAVGAQAPPPLTVRPVGHPFARELKLLAPLPEADSYAVVDEGPGLSGSSFAAAARVLEGKPITFFPGHAGGPGPEASDAWRRRWTAARRLFRDFDEVVAPRLPAWFADLVGTPAAPLEDLSAGRWRQARGVEAPADPQRERRKFRLRAASGDWLAKFAGLGAIGEARLTRARELHAAGFTPQPLAFRHGFLIERWHGEATVPERGEVLDRLGPYLAFRARSFPAMVGDGADLRTLREMAVFNAAEAGVALTLPAYEGQVRPVRTDNRLHAWEWLRLPDGAVLKTDALEHDDAHDLVGCQDIAWDVAGAQVEFDLTADETAALCAAVDADPSLARLLIPCYAAFQLGLWSMAGEEAQAARYRAVLQAAAAAA